MLETPHITFVLVVGNFPKNPTRSLPLKWRDLRP